MKPSYYRRRSAFLSSPGRVAVAIAVVVGVLILGTRLIVPSAFFSLTAPVFAFGNSIAGVGMTVEDVRAHANVILTNENTQLKERIADLTRLLGDEPSGSKGLVAGVIARPPLAPYDTLLVGAGSRDGVAFGMMVSGEGGVPLGTIETVANAHAQVSLFSTAGRVTDGWVGEDRLPLTLTGEGAGAFIAEVPRDASIAVGALVFVPGPGARAVGQVERIDSDPSSSFATLRIRPLANVFSLSLVLIEEPS